jgi:hypothetical protein
MVTNEFNPVFFHGQNNELHLDFLTDYNAELDKYPAVKALVGNTLLARFNQNLDRERSLVHIEFKSPFTEPIEGADHRMDNAVAAIRGVLDVNLRQFDPLKVAAAKRLLDRLRSFGNIGDKPYKEEVMAVRLLVNDLRSNYKDETTLLDLNGWINELSDAEQLFTRLMDERNTEWASRPHDKIGEVHHDTETDYSKMIGIFEADINANGNAKCGEFADRLNSLIKYYNDHSHHRPVKVDIKKADTAPVAVQDYTGVEITPLPEVFLVEEGQPTKKLRFSIDYFLTYRDNVNAGDAEIIIHGAGRFKGKKTITFNIVKV